MQAVYDWTVGNWKTGGKAPDVVPAYEWLVEKADEGGWPKVKKYFVIGLENARKGSGMMTNLWTPTGAYDTERSEAENMFLRRLQLCKPPGKYAKYMIPAWKDPETPE